MHPNAPTHGPNYIAGLDGLRAISVAAVILAHLAPGSIANAVGVDVFFVISGFLITSGLMGGLERSGRVNLLAFYARRFLRLMPALFLLVAALMGLVVAGRGVLTLSPREEAWGSIASLTYLMNWNRAFEVRPEGWLGHAWSLSIEEQFYLLWPLLLWGAYRAWGRQGAFSIALILAIGSAALRVVMHLHGASEARVYNGFDTRADGLLLGCAIALANVPPWLSRWLGRAILVPWLVLAWVFLFVPWGALATTPSTIISIAAGALVIVLYGGSAPRLTKLLELGPLRYCGRISYGLYLWHWPVLRILLDLGATDLVAALATPPITLAIAAASHRWVETPALRLKRRFAHAAETPRLIRPA